MWRHDVSGFIVTRDLLRMRYINWRFTYLLTYLLFRPLTGLSWVGSRVKNPDPFPSLPQVVIFPHNCCLTVFLSIAIFRRSVAFWCLTFYCWELEQYCLLFSCNTELHCIALHYIILHCLVFCVSGRHCEWPPFSAISSSDNLRLGIRLWLGLGFGSVVWLWQYQELQADTSLRCVSSWPCLLSALRASACVHARARPACFTPRPLGPYGPLLACCCTPRPYAKLSDGGTAVF